MGIGNIYRVKSNFVSAQILVTTTQGTTKVKTTDVSYAFTNTKESWKSGVFFTSVVSNASAAPSVVLDGSFDGTNYTIYATLHPDLTTTANTKVVGVSPLPQFWRVRFKKCTTTTHVKVQVRAALRP